VHWPTSLRTGELVVREHDPPARTEVAVHLPATATEDDAGRAAGAVDAALHAAWDVRLTVPVASGEHVVRPRDRTEAAEALAHAQLAEPAGPPKQPAPPGVDPVEDRVWARIAVTSTLLVGAGAALGALRWPPVLTAACLLGLPAAGWLSYVNRRRRAPVVVLLSALAVLLVVLRFVGQVGNVQAASFGVARDPLAELLIAILVIHAADLPQRRNLRFAVAASGVLLLYAGAVRVDPGYGPWIVVWAAAAAWALAAVHRSEVRATGPLGHDRADARPATAVAATAGRLALAGAAAGLVTLGLLALVPVPEGPVRLLTPSQVPVRSPVPVPGAIAAGVGATGAGGGGAAGGGSDGGGAGGTIEYTAFEEQFDTSSRGRPGRHVVMRVRAPAPDFWRGQTFERWDGRTWFASEDRGTFRTGPVMEVTGFDGDPRVPLSDDELVQTYFLEVPMPNLVFAAYRPTRLYLDAGVWMRPDGGLRADTTLPDGAVYTVVSRRVPVTADDLRRQGAPGAPRLGALWADDEMDRYLQLPDSTTERVRSLALAVTAPYTSVYDKVRALEAWIGANTVYDLAAPVPPPGTDAVDHFLFESRRGFCEQISSALVVMLRAIGVPARVAAGYTPGRWDPFAGVWVVRGENAHAWAEVWFPFTGWQAFDPTAEVPLAGDTLDRGTLGGPMLEAVARALAASAGLLVVLVPVGIAAWLVARVVRRRRRVAAAPVGPAQERFERLARRLDIDIGRADSNPSIARHITERRPDAAAAAVAAAAAIDAAAFGHASPEVAEQAVAELDGILRARSPLAVG
jgi:transglutaminase-like putative cysteine protease